MLAHRKISSFASDNAPTRQVVPQAMLEAFTALGYSDIQLVGGQVCALRGFNFTTGLLVHLTEWGYDRRYCYELREDARAALLTWDGRGHPTGPWIKCKGAGIDLLNPAFCSSN